MSPTRKQQRTDLIVATLDDAFAPLMKADPPAFRAKYRKMAKDPHAFFRGTACLFDADVTALDDPAVIRGVLGACARTQAGKPAAATTQRRKRAVFCPGAKRPARAESVRSIGMSTRSVNGCCSSTSSSDGTRFPN